MKYIKKKKEQKKKPTDACLMTFSDNDYPKTAPGLGLFLFYWFRFLLSI